MIVKIIKWLRWYDDDDQDSNNNKNDNNKTTTAKTQLLQLDVPGIYQAKRGYSLWKFMQSISFADGNGVTKKNGVIRVRHADTCAGCNLFQSPVWLIYLL